MNIKRLLNNLQFKFRRGIFSIKYFFKDEVILSTKYRQIGKTTRLIKDFKEDKSPHKLLIVNSLLEKRRIARVYDLVCSDIRTTYDVLSVAIMWSNFKDFNVYADEISLDTYLELLCKGIKFKKAIIIDTEKK